jgi:glycosyltransferase involved in cell wall biosynthesis
MAAGVPVITSPTAGTTEAILDGVTGIVLPVDRPEAMGRGAKAALRTTPTASLLRRPAAGLG